jgi:small subunit ribosomal protein S2
VIARAAADGLMARAARTRGDGDEKPDAGVGSDEPLAEWEQNLLTNGAGSDGASLTAAAPAAEAPNPASEPAPATTSNGTQQTAG